MLTAESAAPLISMREAQPWTTIKEPLRRRIEQVNRELWLILSLVAIAFLLNVAVSSHGVLLGFYNLPAVVSAYLYGRRHATLTALASILVVFYLTYFQPGLLSSDGNVAPALSGWLNLTAWGGILLVTSYLMGTLNEHKQAQVQELRQTYHGVLLILRHFISKDTYTENHCYRVSIYSMKIAAQLKLHEERIEDVRVAALLHDIGKLNVSRELLYKAARLTDEDFKTIQGHVAKGVELLQPVGGSLRRIIPIVLAHHDKFDGSGYHPTRGEEIPIEARILMVADVFDAVTTDRPYRKALSPFEARDIIAKGAGVEFDPQVVAAFMTLFQRSEMEVSPVVV